MGILYTLIIILLTITTIARAWTYIVLDLRNGHKVELTSVKGYVYLLPYDKEVKEEDERLKKICNDLNKFVIFFLIFFISLFLVRKYIV